MVRADKLESDRVDKVATPLVAYIGRDDSEGIATVDKLMSYDNMNIILIKLQNYRQCEAQRVEMVLQLL